MGIYEKESNLKLNELMYEQLKLQVEIEFDTHYDFLIKNGLGSCSNIMDAGTGSGDFLVRAANLHPTIHFTGLDLKKDMIARAEKSAETVGVSNIKWVDGDIAKSPFSGSECLFDGILMRFVSMHISSDIDSVLRYQFKLLKPKGRLWIISVDSNQIRGNYPSGIFDKYRKTFERANAKLGIDGHIGAKLPNKLRKAGFRVETIETDPKSKHRIGIEKYKKYLLHEVAIFNAYAPEAVTEEDLKLINWFVENEVPLREYDGCHGIVMISAVKP